MLEQLAQAFGDEQLPKEDGKLCALRLSACIARSRGTSGIFYGSPRHSFIFARHSFPYSTCFPTSFVSFFTSSCTSSLPLIVMVKERFSIMAYTVTHFAHSPATGNSMICSMSRSMHPSPTSRRLTVKSRLLCGLQPALRNLKFFTPPI